MKGRFPFWISLFCSLSCGAVELVELPEILATFDGVPLKREELAATLKPRLAALDGKRQRDAVVREVRRAVDDEICRRLLAGMLKASGLTPSRELALEYLSGVFRDIPPLRRGELERELLPQADSPDFQLKAAVHIYLVRHFDRGLLQVTDAEIARYYQLNQLRYRLPEKWDVGVIRIDRRRSAAAEIAEATRARLLQGEAFDRVAKEIDPEGGGAGLSPAELRRLFADELTRLVPGDVSRVIAAPDSFYILLLRNKELGGMIPLEEAAGYIRMELSAVKDSMALRKLLSERVDKAHVIYAPIMTED